QAYSVEAMASSSDPTRTIVGYRDSAGNQVELSESVFNGGTLGGLMSFRRETLDSVQNQVGLLASSLALAFNQQHAAGFDLSGDPGEGMFALGEPLVFRNENNVGNANFKVEFDTAPGAYLGLTGSDYSVRVVNSAATPPTFEVTRLNGGEV